MDRRALATAAATIAVLASLALTGCDRKPANDPPSEINAAESAMDAASDAASAASGAAAEASEMATDAAASASEAAADAAGAASAHENEGASDPDSAMRH